MNRSTVLGNWVGGSKTVGKFVTDVLRIYHDHAWLFIKLSAFAVVISFAAITVSRHEAHMIMQHYQQALQIGARQSVLLKISILKGAGYLASWIIFSISFGAICSATRQIEGDVTPSLSESCSAVYKQLGPLLRLSLLLLFFYVMAAPIDGLLVACLFWLGPWPHLRTSYLAIQVTSFGCIGILLIFLSRFALAMPAVVLDNFGVYRSLVRSYDLSRGKWPTLATLLTKSLIGGYVAGMCPFWFAGWVSMSLPSWFQWVLSAVSIAAVTVVEPPMFIGFSLLYSMTSDFSRDQSLPRNGWPAASN